MEDWRMAVGFVFAILIPLGGLIITLYRWTNERNDTAHRQIGKNIDEVKADVREAKADIKEVNIFLRDHFAEKSKRGK